jgi:ferritin-like metal-binding protein YciE
MGIRDVMLDELRDLYSAENQLVKALPKLAKAAQNEELGQAFTSHLEETRGHVERLKQIFTLLGEKPTGKHCKGMEGLVEEGKEAIDEEEDGPSYDLGLIGAAGRVEHYEIAGYTAVLAMAQGVGEDEIAGLLTQTLDEENETREALERHAEELIASAAEAEASGANETEERATRAVSASSRSRSSAKRTKA